MSHPTIGFSGMSHLGLVSAVAAASKGFNVVAYDPDAGLIAALETGRLPVTEPGLDDLFAAHRARLGFTADPKALAGCDFVYVSRDVPTGDDGNSDLSPIDALIVSLDAALPHGTPIVILCQVPPGYTRRRSTPNRPWIYQVETLIFGRAVERATTPERYIVGAGDPRQPLPPAFRTFLEAFGCPILVMRLESAELAKIAINCFLVSTVLTTNMLANVCEDIGADWNEIAPSLRLDRRIGPYAYLAPGLGIAGGNLERDLATVAKLGTASASGLVGTWVSESARRRDWPYHTLIRRLGSGTDKTVAIVGLAYKENTHSTKNSAALRLADQLKGFRLRLFDPVVDAASVAAGLDRAEAAATALEACRGADAVCLMTPWPEFRKLDAREIAGAMRGRLIIDPYDLLGGSVGPDVDHQVLGRSGTETRA